MIQFCFEQQKWDASCKYLTPYKLGVVVPDMKLPPGINEVSVEVCFNGQQFSESHKKFRFLCFTPEMNEKDRQKMEDDLLKAHKKKK